jgi:hypothetical protein
MEEGLAALRDLGSDYFKSPYPSTTCVEVVRVAHWLDPWCVGAWWKWLLPQVVGMVVKVATNQDPGKLAFADKELDFYTQVSD